MEIDTTPLPPLHPMNGTFTVPKSIPNKEPTKEWRGLAQEILDTVGSTKAARSKAWKENALQYIEIRIEEALKVREAELIEKVHTKYYAGMPEVEVIALIKG